MPNYDHCWKQNSTAATVHTFDIKTHPHYQQYKAPLTILLCCLSRGLPPLSYDTKEQKKECKTGLQVPVSHHQTQTEKRHESTSLFHWAGDISSPGDRLSLNMTSSLFRLYCPTFQINSNLASKLEQKRVALLTRLRKENKCEEGEDQTPATHPAHMLSHGKLTILIHQS